MTLQKELSMRWTAALAGILFVALCCSTSAVATKMPSTYTEPITKMQLALIPGGSYTMGDPTDRDPFAKPAHGVTVEAFYLGIFEVTFEQYETFARETQRPIPNDEDWGRGIRPVINVSWYDAVAFTEWLSKKSGRKFRLPSEAEWEYAGRGGTESFFYWGDNLGRSNANCAKCGSPWDGKQTAAVGSFKPNPYGLFDITGNVYEWCLDTRHRSYEGAPTDGSAWIKKGQKDFRGREFRINRGGSWFQPAREMTIYRRCWDAAEDKRSELGFRVLMEP